ncbi:recombinase family protein [Streptosporangium sp. NBC_01639]|uniref:recombinase family protein n=1 Tax=Streptosporangium sp. NBC_01639 TaxID=2975948 RepID=UPI0038656095
MIRRGPTWVFGRPEWAPLSSTARPRVELRRREIGFTSLHESLDTTTPGGRLVFHVFAALAEFIRELIVTGTREGLAAAKARGRVGGRPTVVAPALPPATRQAGTR